MGIYIFSTNLGWVLGPLIGGALLFFGQNVLGLDVLSSYRFPFYVLAILSLIAAALFFGTVKDIIPPRLPARRESSDGQVRVPIDPKTRFELRILYFNGLMNGFSMGTLSFVTVLFMADIAHIEEYLIGIIIGLTGSIGMIANIPAGRQADRIGRKPVLLLGGYLARLAAIMIPFAGFVPLRELGSATVVAYPSLYALIAVSGILGFRFFAFQISQPAMRALQADIIPRPVRGRLIGLMQTMFNIGAIVGAPVGGALYMAFEGSTIGFSPFALPGEGFPFITSSVLGFISLTLILLYIREPKVARKVRRRQK